jgi:non-ribosomal peptide synthetase component F
VKFTLEKKEADGLKAFAAQSNTTLYIFLLSVYYVLLSKLSGAEDIVVGCASAGRRHPDLQQMVGIFINTLALRNYPSSEKKFEDFLAEVKTRTLEAFENQDYPFESLVEKVCGQRDLSRHPLIDVGFTLQNYGSQPGDRGEDKSSADHTTLWTKPYELKRVVAKIDLNLLVYEIEGQQLLFVFQYAKDLFKKEAIEMFAGYFRQILATVTEDLRVRIKDIQLMSEQEKKDIHFGIKEAQEGIQADFVF